MSEPSVRKSVSILAGVAFCDEKEPVANFAAAYAIGSVGFSMQ